MAQSRINKAGSIFTRIDGLLKGKLIPNNERPIWYDIYKTFPPKRDPLYRTILAGNENPSLPYKIFYKEDTLRAYYFKNFKRSDALVLNSTIATPIWEIFVQTYYILAQKGISEPNLVKATIEEMKTKGLNVFFKDNNLNEPNSLENTNAEKTSVDKEIEDQTSEKDATIK